MKNCVHCGKETNDNENYCDWNCVVQSAKDAGYKEICPNNLPINTIRVDGTMLEAEHADHPDYKFQ